MTQKILTLTILLLIGQCVLAQQSTRTDPHNYAADDEVVFVNGAFDMKQKLPSILHKAKKETPEEQYKYAQELQQKGKNRSARDAFNDLVHTWPSSKFASQAQLQLALEYEKTGRYQRAFNEFQYLIEYYPNQFPYDMAIEHQMSIANHIRTSRKWKFFGLPGVSTKGDSIELYNQIVKNAPNWEQTPIAKLYSCMLQEDEGDYESAIAGYELMIQQFPASKHIPEAKFRRVYCMYKLTQRYKRDKQVYLHAMEAAAEFIRDYPTNENIPEAKKYYKECKNTLAKMKYDVAVFYDKVEKDPRAAIIEYNIFLKSFPDSKYSDAARKRLEQLKKEVK